MRCAFAMNRTTKQVWKPRVGAFGFAVGFLTRVVLLVSGLPTREEGSSSSVSSDIRRTSALIKNAHLDSDLHEDHERGNAAHVHGDNTCDGIGRVVAESTISSDSSPTAVESLVRNHVELMHQALMPPLLRPPRILA